MTDAEYAAQKARILALASKWIEPLGLKWWRVQLVYERDGIPRSKNAKKHGGEVAMVCNAWWEYLDAMIRINMPEISAMDDDRLEYVFVHELMHILVNEMRETGISHEERVVTHVAKAFIWVRQYGEGDGRERLEAAHKGVDD